MKQIKSLGRLFAFKFLYDRDIDQLLSLDEDQWSELMESFAESYVAPDEEHTDNDLPDEALFFGDRMIRVVLERKEEFTEKLKPLLGKRKLENLDHFEKIVLLLGCAEILLRKTPRKVVIDEYVEMAKNYGKERSFRFINGVLDKVKA